MKETTSKVKEVKSKEDIEAGDICNDLWRV